MWADLLVYFKDWRQREVQGPGPDHIEIKKVDVAGIWQEARASCGRL